MCMSVCDCALCVCEDVHECVSVGVCMDMSECLCEGVHEYGCVCMHEDTYECVHM